MRLVEMSGLDVVAVPLDTTGAAVAGDYLNLRDYDHLTLIIAQGAWAGGTPAVTLKQATDVAGAGEKALSFTEKWTKLALVASTFLEAAVVSDTFNLTAVANTITVLEIDAASLDVDNEFDCVRIDIASPGANADLISVFAVLSQASYPQAVLPDAKID